MQSFEQIIGADGGGDIGHSPSGSGGGEGGGGNGGGGDGDGGGGDGDGGGGDGEGGGGEGDGGGGESSGTLGPPPPPPHSLNTLQSQSLQYMTQPDPGSHVVSAG